jgi:uncharacterized protein
MLKYFLTAALLFSPFASQGASFNCKKASTRIENLICKNTYPSTEVSKLDEALSDVYSQELKKAKVPAALRSEQLDWLKKVRDACVDEYCLEQVYTERILHLVNSTPDSQPPPPNIFGTFSEKHEICLKGLDSWDCGNPVTDTVTISPGSQNTVSVALDLTFENGHICRLERTGRWENGVVILPLVWGGKIYSCKLALSATDNEITITDRDSCTEQSCGARGSLHNVKLKRNR